MDIANAPWSAKLSIPILAGAVIAYGAAPIVGIRHATNTGEITKCEAAQAAQARRDVERRTTALQGQIRTFELPKVGALIRNIFETLPNGKAYCEFYKCDEFGKALETFKMPNPAQEQTDAAKAELQALRDSFKLDTESAKSTCECAARQAINDGHLPLTVFVATGGLVRTGPVADWQAAMRKAMPACRESNP